MVEGGGVGGGGGGGGPLNASLAVESDVPGREGAGGWDKDLVGGAGIERGGGGGGLTNDFLPSSSIVFSGYCVTLDCINFEVCSL